MNTQPFSQTDQMIDLYCDFLSVRCMRMYIITKSHSRFRVNLHSKNHKVTNYYDHDCRLQEMKYMLPDKFIRGNHSINFSKFGSRTFIIGNNTDTNDQSFGQFNRLDSLIK